MNYKIFPIYNGSFTVKLGGSNAFPDIKNIPSFCFLLVGEDDYPVLIDTGFDSNFIPGINSEYQRQQELPQALARVGVDIEKIELVIQTHLHWDHTGGMKYLPRAAFVLQKRELDYLYTLPFPEECSFCPAHWLPVFDRLQLLDGTADIRPGLRVLLTGGHTGGHQVVEVSTSAGKIIIGGDAPFNYDSMWNSIPHEYWDRYRQGPGQKFFWGSEVRQHISSYLSKWASSSAPETPFTNVKQLPGQLVLSHDPRLAKISILP